MASTRILVADSPRFQREIVTELLLDRADVEMVEATALYEEAEHRRPDVVILGEDDPAMARALLEASPRLVVLALADSELRGLALRPDPVPGVPGRAVAGGAERRDRAPGSPAFVVDQLTV